MSLNSDIVLRWYEDVWHQGKLHLIDKLYRPAPSTECLVQEGPVPANETREFIALVEELIDDKTVRVLHIVENGDWVSAMVQLDGVKSGTAEPVHLRWLSMLRIEKGCIVESYPSANFMSLFEQMGQLPENTFELLLGGTVLS